VYPEDLPKIKRKPRTTQSGSFYKNTEAFGLKMLLSDCNMIVTGQQAKVAMLSDDPTYLFSFYHTESFDK